MTTLTQAITGAGSLTKKEKLKEIHTKLFNTTVLEVEDPFPGYYHEIPRETNINSIFLLVHNRFYPENILRATNLVSESLDFEFSAAYSRLSFGPNNVTHVAIRLQDVKRYDDIKRIQQAYSDAGIDFEPEMNLNLKDPVIININRVYNLEEAAEGIYTFADMPDSFYLLLKRGGDWEWFEKLVFKVKNNFHRANFDAAHSVIYKKGALLEFVRIYDDKMTLEEAHELRELFLRYS